MGVVGPVVGVVETAADGEQTPVDILTAEFPLVVGEIVVLEYVAPVPSGWLAVAIGISPTSRALAAAYFQDGDGRFAFDFEIVEEALLGTYTFLFYSRDKAGNLSYLVQSDFELVPLER